MTVWTTFTLRVDTPLFSGGTTGADAGTIIRPPSIRGVLRYWYRAVAAGHTMRSVDDLPQLADSETAVFGSTATPSPIRLRVTPPAAPAENAVILPAWARRSENGFAGARYLLGQGLCTGGRKPTLSRPHLPVDTTFDLNVALPENPGITQGFMLALWAWLTYGGLGARTRRGFGRLSCIAINNPPPGWSPALLHPTGTPGAQLARWRTIVPAEIAYATKAAFPETPDPDDNRRKSRGGLSPFPILSKETWSANALDLQPRPLSDALHRTGAAWRLFRNDAATDDYTAATPEWGTTILGPDNSYPVAALGLPVNYYRPQDGLEASVNLHLDNQPARRASPVWLTPVRLGATDNYTVFTHIFYADLAPTEQEAVLRLDGGPAPRPLTLPSAATATAIWNTWLGAPTDETL
ncbi:type III-B CRISPR module RAMP protein Cmr1 [Amycolatopsis sp. OK19-0408]|uniref:Type III-B CRISPR module RAMP protein Cmr1 n=1 Tax=Amycolatopsis iheyensis TaxID=2945988 RepID=A0A9X2NKD0_9PSEU|nr:type III-B CRISPR module RAMP protein Cmr1 [Amycolatopsis iheyensis]MCR6488390.1 type III-B CRISPR module RAMP protein Cmr1 [Amycolatopsis iheyensis]